MMRIVICICFLLGLVETVGAQNKYKALDLGNESYEQGKYEDALSYYRHSTDRDSAFFEARFNEGVSLQRSDKLEDALLAYNEAEEIADNDKKRASVFYNRGNIHMQKEDYESAVEDYKKVLRTDPKHEKARYNLGYALAKMKEQQQQQKQDDKQNDKKDDKEEKDNKDQQDQKENKDQQQNQDQKDNKDQQQKKDDKEGKDKKDDKNKEGEGKDQKKKQNEEQKGDKGKGQNQEQQASKDGQKQPGPGKEAGGKISQKQAMTILNRIEKKEQAVQKKVNKQRATGVKIRTEKDW